MTVETKINLAAIITVAVIVGVPVLYWWIS